MLEFQRRWNGPSAGTNGNAGLAVVAGIIIVENSISKAGDLMNLFCFGRGFIGRRAER